MAGHGAALALAQLEGQGLVLGSDSMRAMTFISELLINFL